MITKLVLKNFCRFSDAVFEFEPGLNILVGNNDAGKSTILEAINLCLTKRWNGRYFEQEFSHHFITSCVVDEYVHAVHAGKSPQPPEVAVELYFNDEPSLASFKGTNNSLKENVPGYRLHAALDRDFDEEYRAFLYDSKHVTNLPTEFYKVEWTSFSGQPINPRLPKIKSSLIDASRIRLQSGADYHLQRIISETLDTKQRAVLARTFRVHQESFAEEKSVQSVNHAMAVSSESITKKKFSLQIDTSGANGWESALSPHLDALPFQFSGSGEQQRLKILLALARNVDGSHVILIEEPENHLSFSNLNELIERIGRNGNGRQVIIATHSSFVVNKLGLDQLMLVSDGKGARLTSLPQDTQAYFRKLPGYDTLRLVLAKKVALVEGPSDELVFQRAYRDLTGRRPIDDGVDTICVRGLSAPRFLDLAIPLRRSAVVVTDNDGDHAVNVDDRYKKYTKYDFIKVHTGQDDSLKTLEPQMLNANGRCQMNSILGRTYSSEPELLNYMKRNKTDVAMAIFDTNEDITWPKYIREAIDDIR